MAPQRRFAPQKRRHRSQQRQVAPGGRRRHVPRQPQEEHDREQRVDRLAHQGVLRATEKRRRATIGEVANEEHSLRQIGKAGAVRWRGIRPTVRGVAMNPVDHPHGGGEGRTGEGGEPRSPWGTPAKGYKTRSNKRTDNMIVQRRKRK